MMDKFVKGDYNTNHCELYEGNEHFGDVRTDDADKFIDLINGLIEENNLLKKENQELRRYLSWQDMELEEMEDLND